jgi:acetyl esterase/lipase
VAVNQSAVPPEPDREPDEIVRYGSLPDQVADLWRPAETGRPLIVLIHGGFWRARYDRLHLRPMAAALRARGWPVAAIEYRRLTGNPDAATGDVRQALMVLPGTMPGEGILLAGHSAGGHLALWAASACPPANLTGTVALAPVADLVAAHDAGLSNGAVAEFLGDHPSARPDLDPVRLSEPRGRVVLIHGTEDADVPLGMSRSYVRAHPAARLVVLPDTGHFALIDPASKAWPRVVTELESAGRAGSPNSSTAAGSPSGSRKARTADSAGRDAAM